jgi:hypothetical protein
MHGMFFSHLRQFCDAYDADTWRAIHQRNGLHVQPYLPITSYPLERFIALFEGLSDVVSAPRSQLLDAFGVYIAPHLLTYPGVTIPGYYRALQVLEDIPKIEAQMAERSEAAGKPPNITTRRTGEVEVTLGYTSPARLCALGKGIIRGIAKHFRETVTMHEQSCMLLGAPACTLIVRRRGTTTTHFKAIK